MSSIGLLCVRMAVAWVLFAHGAHKLFGAFAGPGIGSGGMDATMAQFKALGIEPAFFLAAAAGLVQFLGGILLLTGWFTRWAAGANLIYMIIGVWKEHGQWGLFLNWTGAPGQGHGYEYSLIFGAVLLLLCLNGPGDLSIDGRRARYVATRNAGRARLRRA